jgi:hypothetical protein
MPQKAHRAAQIVSADVLDRLDALASLGRDAREHENGWQCQRSRRRRAFRLPCEMWYYQDHGRALAHQKLHTRNINERGIAVVGRCVVLQGVPVEIRLCPPGRLPLHLAGLVAFCRYTTGGLHEIGVVLQSAQNQPVFSSDPVGAPQVTPWLREALRSLSVRASAGC